MKRVFTSTQGRSCRGFSLIEVTIAMAIAAVAISTLLGLIPQGLDTMRQAGDEAIQGRIHQQILNELQMVPFDGSAGDVLNSYHRKEFYYDAQGEELDAADKGSFSHIYSARVSILAPGGGSAPPSVDGASFNGYSFDGGGGGTENQYVRPVIVEVAPVAGLAANFDFDDPQNFHLISSYQSVVAKMGQDYAP